jgi:hypothetical protein
MNVGDRLSCRKCGHGWYARVPRPIQCPRCKSTTWARELQVAETRVKYEPRSKKTKMVRFEDMPSFGMWADLTESDEELLNRLGGGWAELEIDDEQDELSDR